MTVDFLQQLQKAQSGDERNWLVTENLLNSLSPTLKNIVYGVALPHWFNEEILGVLFPQFSEQIREWYFQLQSLPFVEPFIANSFNIHEQTRRLILDYLWREQNTRFVELSNQLADYFLGKQEQIEYIYHVVVGTPDKGEVVLQEQAQYWQNNINDLNGLLNRSILFVKEHLDAKRLNHQNTKWFYFLKGLDTYKASQYTIARDIIEINLSLNEDSNYLKAYTYRLLGDIFFQLDETNRALANYKIAFSAYRAIGDTDGEIHCFKNIQALGRDDNNFNFENTKESLRYLLSKSLQKLENHLEKDFVSSISPIIWTNLMRGRIQAYLSNSGKSPEEYVWLVAEQYENQYPIVSKLQETRDNEAWKELYVKLDKKAYQYYLSYGKSPKSASEMAEETANETATRLLSTHFPYDVNFETWANTILRYVCMARLKSLAIQPSESLTNFEEKLTDLSLPTGRNLEGRMESREKLVSAINNLASNRRQVILLHYFENLSFEEIAKRMDKTISAVYQLHNQARRDLGKSLGEDSGKI